MKMRVARNWHPYRQKAMRFRRCSMVFNLSNLCRCDWLSVSNTKPLRMLHGYWFPIIARCTVFSLDRSLLSGHLCQCRTPRINQDCRLRKKLDAWLDFLILALPFQVEYPFCLWEIFCVFTGSVPSAMRGGFDLGKFPSPCNVILSFKLAGFSVRDIGKAIVFKVERIEAHEGALVLPDGIEPPGNPSNRVRDSIKGIAHGFEKKGKGNRPCLGNALVQASALECPPRRSVRLLPDRIRQKRTLLPVIPRESRVRGMRGGVY